MKSLFGTISVILFLFIQNAPAQNRFSVSLGGGYLFSSIDPVSTSADQTKLPYWNNGYLINLTGEYKMTDKLSFFLSTSWQKHYYHENLVQFYHVEIAGYDYSISGEKSTLYELSAGGKFYLSESWIKPYIGVGIGALLINQGKIEISSWIGSGSTKNVDLWQDSDKTYLLMQINLNVGLEYNLFQNLSVVLNGQLVTGLWDGPIYFPVTTSLKLGL
jgi:opacity protein-like surface antigen